MLDGEHAVTVVVAHHDDEVLFCGGLLSKFKYTDLKIVAMSYPKKGRRDSNTRIRSFINVCNKLGALPFLTDFQDGGGKVKGKFPNYGEFIKNRNSQYNDMVAYLKDVFRGTSQIVITHNMKGEYGHLYHRLVHDVCVDALPAGSRMLCFGLGMKQYTEIEYDVKYKKELLSYYAPGWDPLPTYPWALDPEKFTWQKSS